MFDVNILKFCHTLWEVAMSNWALFHNIYILSVVALDETNISGCLHFSMQNIEMSFDLDCTTRRSNVNVSQ